MSQKTLLYAKRSDTKLSPSIIHKPNGSFEPSFKNPNDKITYLQRMVGNRSVGRLLNTGVLQTKFQIDQSSRKHGNKIRPAAINAVPRITQREENASTIIMRQARFEFYCYNPAQLSDRQLLREIKKIKMGRYKGMCTNKTESEQEYREALELEAEKRGLFTHPTGIAKTRFVSYRQYGADFTHKLSISQGGLDVDLQGTKVREKIRIDRDDFNLPRAQPAQWILGEMKESRKADEFTDCIETGNYGVEQATSTKRFSRIPPVREETQFFYWRRNRRGSWKRFATVKAIFKVDVCKRRRYGYCAVTIDNGVRIEQRFFGKSPKRR